MFNNYYKRIQKVASNRLESVSASVYACVLSSNVVARHSKGKKLAMQKLFSCLNF